MALSVDIASVTHMSCQHFPKRHRSSVDKKEVGNASLTQEPSELEYLTLTMGEGRITVLLPTIIYILFVAAGMG